MLHIYSLDAHYRSVLRDPCDRTTFIVSFTPTEYGKTLVGKLVIHTDDMQWTYLIRGTHPKYQAPTVNAVVSSKLSQKFMPVPRAAVRGRNILRENMKAAASSPNK